MGRECLMEQAASKHWPEGITITGRYSRRRDGLWRDIQTEEQERIGTTLHKIYAELVQR